MSRPYFEPVDPQTEKAQPPLDQTECSKQCCNKFFNNLSARKLNADNLKQNFTELARETTLPTTKMFRFVQELAEVVKAEAADWMHFTLCPCNLRDEEYIYRHEPVIGPGYAIQAPTVRGGYVGDFVPKDFRDRKTAEARNAIMIRANDNWKVIRDVVISLNLSKGHQLERFFNTARLVFDLLYGKSIPVIRFQSNTDSLTRSRRQQWEQHVRRPQPESEPRSLNDV